MGEKKTIEVLVFRKQNQRNSIKFSEIDIEIEDNDIIQGGYEEPEYRSDGGHDGYFYLEIYRSRIETDNEYNERVENEKIQQKELKKQRFERYIDLRKEFEVADPIINTD